MDSEGGCEPERRRDPGQLTVGVWMRAALRGQFALRLVKTPDDTLIWNPIAFGERHPDNPNTRTVYERAHKRLHGHYPQ